MPYQVGERVRVNLAGLHPKAETGVWVPAVVTAVTPVVIMYTVRIDEPLEGRADFGGIMEDRIQAPG